MVPIIFYLLYVSGLYLIMNAHDKQIVHLWFKSPNILLYNKKWRDIILNYQIPYNFIYILGAIYICLYTTNAPFRALKNALSYYKYYNISFIELFWFNMQNPYSINTLGCIYNGFHLNSITMDTNYLYGFMDKMFWYNLFKQLNIKTPEIVGYHKNGQTVLDNKTGISHDKKYILKPFYEYRGKGIQLFKLDKIYALEGEYIIQEKLSFDNANTLTYIRCVTSYKFQQVRPMFLYIHTNSQQLVLGHAPYIITYEVDLHKRKMRDLTTHEWIDLVYDVTALHKCVEQSIQLHEYFIKNSIPLNSIAFDIILSNNIPYFLEGNQFFGTVFPEDVHYISNYNKYIKSIS